MVSDGSPLIVYSNHSSWWDPMVLVFLAERFFSHQRHYAPMDAEALNRYAILKRLGIFPVEMKTQRGAVQFLRVGEAILNGGGVLWVTPQGRFVDARQRPLAFKPGMAALARRVAEHGGRCTLLPLAIEYPFWDERVPETLLHIGTAVHVTEKNSSVEDIQAELTSALEIAMDELKAQALQRDPARFTTLLGGNAGSGGFYALSQRIRAFVRRQPYQPEHTVTAKVDAVAE